ncbi:dihydrodipicolinate synthase family protein [Nocardioides zeicaulis]|uniref:Dihydrodipicolinate synthase family protein n=1 Tax=Nocardioides zeicaulis TaxID=1776857 RepID=A0ABV6DWR6_9ACTN
MTSANASSRTGTMEPLLLPASDGTLTPYRLRPRSEAFNAELTGKPATRSVYAAAHVVANPFVDPTDRGTANEIDWNATMAFRRHLMSLGLGVADAMDTAQRGGGLDWTLAKTLIQRSGAEARAMGGNLVCGALTDQLAPGQIWPLEQLVDAYLEQATWIRECGGVPVLMASRHLAAAAASVADYERVYDDVLRQVDGPVFMHWLGEAFDPSLRGYWGTTDLDAAADTFLAIIGRHSAKVAGVKISLLDEQREVDIRRRLPEGVLMHTGDDFNYVPLIAGDGPDGHDHSHALLGVFDALAVPARAALARLDDGDIGGFAAILEPTVPLARHLFTAPTSAYKTGVVFLAWLNGHQDHFRMVAGAELQRSVLHLTRVLTLADEAGALADPDLAHARMRSFLATVGIES